jgi:hypothetical protein
MNPASLYQAESDNLIVAAGNDFRFFGATLSGLDWLIFFLNYKTFRFHIINFQIKPSFI